MAEQLHSIIEITANDQTTNLSTSYQSLSYVSYRLFSFINEVFCACANYCGHMIFVT